MVIFHIDIILERSEIILLPFLSTTITPDGGKPIQIGDTSYIYKGIYNPIIWFEDKPYRPRVEMLVLDENKESVLLRIKSNINKTNIPKKRQSMYDIPGGSRDIDSSKIQQAINEVNEEALITVGDVVDVGIQYFQLYEPGFLAKGGDSPLEYYGSITDVFVGVYSGKYDKSKVNSEDLAPEIANESKWYYLPDIAKFLRKEHINALLQYPYLPGVIKTAIQLHRMDIISESLEDDTAIRIPQDTWEDIELAECFFGIEETVLESEGESMIIMERTYPDDVYGLPERKAYPMPDAKHVKSAIKFFNYAKEDEEEELAKNINRQIRRFKMKDINVGKKNRFRKYYEPIEETASVKAFYIQMNECEKELNDSSISSERRIELYEREKKLCRDLIVNLDAGIVAERIPEQDKSNMINAAYNALAEASCKQLEIMDSLGFKGELQY